MEVQPGSVVGLIGRNGAGKSTTIKSILGLVKADEGEVELFGKNISEMALADKEEIGVAFANAGFAGMLTVADIVKILRKTYHGFDEDYFKGLCRKMQLPENKKISEFSTGMKAKLRVLVAVSHKAKLIILDEPTAGLDVIARNEVLNILRDYMEQDSERTVLISSHISTDLEGLCDEIYLIDNGRLLLHEDTDAILDGYAVLKLTEEQYRKADRNYFLAEQKTNFGYEALTNEKQFYLENYPEVVVESGNIDKVIMMMTDHSSK